LTDKAKSILPVKELKNLLGRYRVIAAYFFGSRIEGVATENSDYDFAILVDKEYEQDDINCLLLELKDEVIRDYLDFKPFLDLYRKEVREAIKEGHFYGK